MQRVSFAERPELDEQTGAIAAAVWPEYNRQGNDMGRWADLATTFPEFQFALMDDDGTLLADGLTVPVPWDGTAKGLPEGVAGALNSAFEPGVQPTALCALAAEIHPDHQGRGLSAVVLRAMADLAREHGFSDLIAPVRPSAKERYPLIPIEQYMVWHREADGLHFDPWLRVHIRAGGEILAPEPHGMRIEAPVEAWEAWTGLALPDDGRYVFPHGLAPLTVVDGIGRYWEPNVWVRHRC
jgi:GNAT superfamily N-acetyltransferase